MANRGPIQIQGDDAFFYDLDTTAVIKVGTVVRGMVGSYSFQVESADWTGKSLQFKVRTRGADASSAGPFAKVYTTAGGVDQTTPLSADAQGTIELFGDDLYIDFTHGGVGSVRVYLCPVRG